MAEVSLDKLKIEIVADTKSASTKISNFTKKIEKLTTALGSLDNIAKSLGDIGNGISGATPAINNTLKSTKNLTKGFDEVAKSAQLAGETMIDASTVKADEPVDKLGKKAKSTNKELNNTKSALQRIKDIAAVSKNTFNSVFGGVINKLQFLTRMVGRRVLYRGINAVISAITSGFGEGVNAVYQYSKALDGRFAKSMDSLASSVNYMKASLGAMAAPLINSLAPVLQRIINKFVEWLDIINQVFARLSGESTYMKAVYVETEYAAAADDAAKATDKATKANEKLKKSLIGLDQINALSDNSKTATESANGAATASSPFKFEEVPIDTAKIDKIIERFSKIKDLAVAIGTAILTWKVSQGLLTAIDSIKKLQSQNYTWGFALTGVALFLDGWNKIKDAIKDISEKGFTFENSAKLISGGLEIISSALIMFGETRLGGVFLTLSAVADIASSIASMIENGFNFNDAMKIIKDIALLVAGISLIKGNLKIAGWSLVASGITTVIKDIGNILDALKTGDWSKVNVAEDIGAVVAIVAGLVMAYGKVSKIANSVKGASDASTALSKVGDVTKGVSDATGALSSKLVSLAKNLGLGLVIIAEVAVAAGLIVGAIWGLGLMLEQVGKAWQPVIDNGKTIATAMGIGTTMLAVIGAVTAALGTAGGALVANIAIGTAVLAELGIATGLFLAEIWAIGYGLEQIGKAWQPVIDNGEVITQGIAIGSGVLLAIGVATAALGLLTVASAGTLPVAIAIGTAMLVELGVATTAFIESLVIVANALADDLYPALVDLNAKLPTLADNMNSFTTYMGEFTSNVVSYTKNSAIAGLSATVDKVIKFFTADPIKAMYKNIAKQNEQVKSLNDILLVANPELKTANDLITTYYGFLQKLEKLTNLTNNISLANGMFVSMKEVGKKLVTGFVDGIKSKYSDLSKAIKTVLSNALTSSTAYSYGSSFGKNIARGISDGFKSGKFPTLTGSVNVANSGSVSLKLRAFAQGGIVDAGQLFIARERGAELVGNIGGQTAVMNNDQIVESVSSGVARANDASNALLRELIRIGNELLDKPSDTVITTSQITDAFTRMNRRAGQTVIATGR